jgi:hypothetical protein
MGGRVPPAKARSLQPRSAAQNLLLPADHSGAALRSLGAVEVDLLHSRDRGRLPGAKFVVASSLERDLPKAAPRVGMAYHIRLKVQPTAVNNALYRPNNARHFALPRARASHRASANAVCTAPCRRRLWSWTACDVSPRKPILECRCSLRISVSQRETRRLGTAVAILAICDNLYAACSC